MIKKKGPLRLFPNNNKKRTFGYVNKIKNKKSPDFRFFPTEEAKVTKMKCSVKRLEKLNKNRHLSETGERLR